jgi:hypothetical protein
MDALFQGVLQIDNEALVHYITYLPMGGIYRKHSKPVLKGVGGYAIDQTKKN